MKKSLLLLAGLALATTAANAQDVTPANPKTEVEVRDNGTVKTTTKTGKTDVGATLDNTKDAAGNVAVKTGSAVKRGARKTGSVVKRGAKKTTHAVKKGARKTSNAAKEGSQKLEEKTE
ncbi:hypothetical protein I2I05_12485 [Hymenobacter sp. BT683]|uniref:Uncharacterized protein n=1 Tax=Hymenobacter jeongseonensis TaxID=2791027 RepID=A0ABS0IIP0_9BACT|nr:hypothetical protein [Hymenobacter jeongseonensis]MBF9238213.1 hypothetical protein [Hymenobacter jeongseonensis]